MKKLIFGLLLALMPLCTFATETVADTNAPQYKWVTRRIDDFVVKLPLSCIYNRKLSEPEKGCYAWATPDKSFVFLYCYFKHGKDFSPKDRLIGEAAQMNMKINGDGDIAYLKVDDTRFMSFAFTSQLGIGVLDIHPEDQVGVCYFVLMPKSTGDGDDIVTTLASVRM